MKAEPITWVCYGIYMLVLPGSLGVGAAMRALRRRGLRAKAAPSPYVGHTELWVEKGKKGAASKVLKPLGYGTGKKPA